MRLIFSGDRSSKTIRFGKLFRRVLGKKFVGIDLWDGYKSRVYIMKEIK
jgi:hypothetical protein